MLAEVMPVLRKNTQLLRRAEHVMFAFCVSSSNDARLISVFSGEVRVAALTAADAPAFTLSAPESAWQEYAAAKPSPGHQDIIAMVESGHAEVDGPDMLKFFANLWLVKGIVSALMKGEATW